MDHEKILSIDFELKMGQIFSKVDFLCIYM